MEHDDLARSRSPGAVGQGVDEDSIVGAPRAAMQGRLHAR